MFFFLLFTFLIFNFMTTKHKHTFLLLFIITLTSCSLCKKDQFGEELILEVPVTIETKNEIIRVGDTMYIELTTDKNVKVRNTNATIYLENFNFFTEFYLAEVSDTFENFYFDYSAFDQIGEAREINLSTVNTI